MKQKQWLSYFLCLILWMHICPMQIYGDEVNPPTISAESAILMDAKTKTILYEKNAYDTHYPASITKLMTALLAIEHLDPEDTITFSKNAVYSIEPGSNHIGIQPDEVLTVDQALHGLLLMSANEVANGLAEAVSGSMDAFAELMTERAKELGAQNTHFTNAHGLHNENHYTTAYDMALIASYISEDNYFLDIMQDMRYTIPCTNITDEERPLYQQHPLLNPSRDASLYREDVIGGKTGYTDQARQTLVTMAKQGDTTLVAVVLQAEKPGVYSDTSALLDYGFSSYQSLTLHTTDDIVKTLPCYNVKSGQAYQSANYGLSLADDASVVVLNSVSAEDIVPSYDIPESLDPTYQLGDSVGKVSYVLNGETLTQSELIITQIDSLPEPTFASLYPKLSGWLILLCILIVVFIICLIIYRIRKNRRRKKYLKINRLFK